MQNTSKGRHSLENLTLWHLKITQRVIFLDIISMAIREAGARN